MRRVGQGCHERGRSNEAASAHLCGKEPRQPLQLCGVSSSEHVAVKYQKTADNLWKQSLRTRKASKPAAVGGLLFIIQQQYVAYWQHKADMSLQSPDVRYWGAIMRRTSRMSAFGP